VAHRQKDNRLEILRLQGGYLYDKGENDEQIFRVGLHNRFTNIILSSLSKKVKKFFKKFYFFIFCKNDNIKCSFCYVFTFSVGQSETYMRALKSKSE
jgi:hypothetical protein